MRIDANDPRLTAYALGELSDPTEIAEIENALENSEELRRLVDEVRGTADLLAMELRAEPSMKLTSDQRSRIEKKAISYRSWFGFKPAWALAAAAAAVMLISFIAIKQLNRTPPASGPVEVAENFPEALKTAPLNPSAAATASGRAMPKPAPPAAAQPPAPVERFKKQASAAFQAPAAPSGASVESKGASIKVAGADAPEGREAKAAATNEKFKPSDSVEVAAATENLLLESGSSVGQVLPEEKVVQLPLVSGNVLDLVKTMAGGIVRTENPSFGEDDATLAGLQAPNVNIQKDGVTANDVRWATGMNGPVNLNPESVGQFKVILAPVDAEMARGRGEMVVKGRDGRLYAVRRPPKGYNAESYEPVQDNPFLDAAQNPLSTFSIDVDTASYSNMRRFLDRGSLPPKDSIRIEELVNYFDYDYSGPRDDKPFAANFELTEAPWNREHLLLRIGLKGREIDRRVRPSCNLVFLLDISGSMDEPNKLPLVKQSMQMLLDQLTESDKVSIVVYATDTKVWLPPTRGHQKTTIRAAIDSLAAGGATNGASGIQLAYRMAQEGFIKKGVNRVILATDGDFNVGMTDRGALAGFIEEKAKSGVFLSALGFGMGNLKDATLEMLANKGRGNYAYIDTWHEARKVLVEQMDSTLITIAKDVKIQVEFNPKFVGAYRLIGYEDKLMAKEDFNNDEKMASSIGAGHRVTALYEIVLPGNSPAPGVDPLKYQKQPRPSANGESDEMLTLKIRSKEPEGEKSVLSEYTVKNTPKKFLSASADFKFAAAVAAFGMVLRDSPYKGTSTFNTALEWAREGKGNDRNGYREEFIRLVHRASSIRF